LPIWIFRSRVLNAAALGSLVVGVLTLGLSSYVPLFAQVVLGHGAVVAGLTLASMTIGWPIAASTSGRFYLSIGFRATMLMGAAFAVAGAGLLVSVGVDTSLFRLAASCFLMGVGFGFVASPAIVAAQSSVTWQHRGVATGANMFARSVGSSVGVAVFGAVANGVVARRVGGGVPDLEHLPSGVLAPAIHAVFLASAALSVLLVVVGILMPRRIVEPATDQ
jgi:MFS family permease